MGRLSLRLFKPAYISFRLILTLIAVVFYTFYIAKISPESYPTALYILIIYALFSLVQNIVLAFKEETFDTLLKLNFLLDVLFLTYTIFLAGPIGEKLVFIYLTLISIYSYLYGFDYGLFVAVVCTLLYLGYFFATKETIEGSDWVVLNTNCAFMVITFLVSTFLKKQENELLTTIDEVTKQLVEGAVSSELVNLEMKDKNQEIQTLYSISRLVSQSLEQEDLFSNLTLALNEVIKFRNFSLFLFDEEDDKLRAVISNGIFGPNVKIDHLVFRNGEGVAGWSFKHNVPIKVSDIHKDSKYVQLIGGKLKSGSMMCCPLVYQDRKIGVMNVDSTETSHFTERDFVFFTSISSLIAVALSNSMHFKEVREQSVTDELTGLINYRFFQKRLRDQVFLAMENNLNLSLLMIDIDHFKEINDTFGHQNGNLILQQLSRIFHDFFRKDDIIARFGGEEFAIILTGTPEDRAAEIAETVRARVETYKFKIENERRPYIDLTVSIGVASNDLDDMIPAQVEDGSSLSLSNIGFATHQLVKSADTALYRAKSAGRNKVIRI